MPKEALLALHWEVYKLALTNLSLILTSTSCPMERYLVLKYPRAKECPSMGESITEVRNPASLPSTSRWASTSGLPRRQPETPYEYQERLQASFPPGEPEIQAITAAYTAHRYGLVDASVEHLGLLNQLWRRLINVIRSGITEIDQD